MTQRNTQQATLAGDTRGAGGGEAGGSAKRQKISTESGPPKKQPTEAGGEVRGEGDNVPPRDILRVSPPGGNNPSDPSQISLSTEPPASSTVSNLHLHHHHAGCGRETTQPGQQQLSAEDVLVRCMLQMAQQQQQQGVQLSSTHQSTHSFTTTTMTTSTLSSSVQSSSCSNPSTTPVAMPTTTSVAMPTVVTSSDNSRESTTTKLSKVIDGPNSMFSRGNFAPLDHLSASSHLPPKFHARVAKTTPTSTSMMSSSSSSSSTTPPCHTHPTLSTTTNSAPPVFTNADVSRLIPHLEAIAASMQQNPPSPHLEHNCLAAFAQTHLLPALAAAQYDSHSPASSPQAAEVLNTLQSFPLITPDGKTIPLTNSSSVDSASYLASLDITAWMQSLMSSELQEEDLVGGGGDIHSQQVYYNSLKKAQQKIQTTSSSGSPVVESSVDSTSGGGGGGRGGGQQQQRFESDLTSNQTRPLTTSFLLDHNFPMDIPPPTDLLPEHVSQLEHVCIHCMSIYVGIYSTIYIYTPYIVLNFVEWSL